MDTSVLDTIAIIINALCWVFASRLYVKKYKLSNLGSIYILFYTALSLMAVHLYYDHPDSVPYDDQNLFGLLYLFSFILLFCLPLIKVSNNKMLVHQKGHTIAYMAIVITALSVIGIGEDIKNFGSGMFQLATDDEYGAELYSELRNTSGSLNGNASSATNYILVLSNTAKRIAPFFFLYYLSRPKINIFVFLGLALSTLLFFMNAISAGQRSGIVVGVMNIAAFYFFMHKYYRKRIQRIVKPIVISVGVVILGALSLITISRATALNSSNNSTFSFVESYACQSILNFGRYGIDPGECRYGDRTFPLVKSFFTKDVAKTYYDRVVKYKKLKINEKNFITFVGDFTIDFGPIVGAIVMLLFIYMFTTTLHSSGNIGVSHLCMIYMLINFLNGFYLYTLSDFGGNLVFLLFVFLYLFFSINDHRLCKIKRV